jgi:hypothetical protein
MWISNAWYCIIDEDIVIQSSMNEINRRSDWYEKNKDETAVKICKKLLKKIHS